MLESIDYKKIFTYFEEISNVPRGSYHNEKISEYLVAFAKAHQLEYWVDEAYNVVIKKPASKTCQTTEPVMLQGHMDMVCVSEDGDHEFLTQGLSLRIQGDYLDCQGTTLGGDDGIALAYCLALLDGDSYVHPPLEVVFTTDEEVGMEGAMALDVSDLKAKRLINIDNEEEGSILVSCAGGATAQVVFLEEKTSLTGRVIEVRVEGLLGGHSGTEIHKHPLNAALFLARLLHYVWHRQPFHLLSFQGGDKDNVITNGASAALCCGENGQEVYKCLKEYAEILKKETASHQPKVSFVIDEPKQMSLPESGFTHAYTKCVLSFMNLVITGVQVMSHDVPGMVESSLNMGIAQTKEDGIQFGFSVRSQKESYREHMLEQIRDLAQCVSGESIQCRFAVRGKYPAWDYRQDSPLREIMTREFEKIFQRKPRVEGIHAGLECGVLSQKMPELDIVSFGPDILDIHTVKERLSISSAKKNFDLLVNVLEQLAMEHVDSSNSER